MNLSNPSEIRNAVVLVIDRLGANMLSAYGNTMFETENFNRLAARSIVFDHAIAPTTQLETAYKSFWSGRLKKKSLMEIAGAHGISSALLTDDEAIENHELSRSFDRVIPIRTNSSTKLGSSVEQTELAGFFAQATQWLSALEPGSLTWLHSRGLSGAWDAPYELRCRFADSEDPDPPDFYQPPAKLFDKSSDDPDELLGYQQACAAQVMMLDDFLGVILDLMDDPAWESTLFCVMSPRGYPMGEHQIVGELQASTDSTDAVDSDSSGYDDQKNEAAGSENVLGMYSESVHVPLMVCMPNRKEFDEAKTVRNGSLVQTDWVFDLLSSWFADLNEDSSFEQIWKSAALSLPRKRHEAAWVVGQGFRSIQTHAWKLITNGQHSELFAKPDDRWEVNDVSRRCPQVVEDLAVILDGICETGGLGGLELPEHLAIRYD